MVCYQEKRCGLPKNRSAASCWFLYFISILISYSHSFFILVFGLFIICVHLIIYFPFLRLSFLSLVKICNHKRLGIYYLLSAFIFGISGTLISVLIRIELYSSGNRIISPENQNFYNISITLHGFLMIFFLVMPGLFGGFGNYFAEGVWAHVHGWNNSISCNRLYYRSSGFLEI